MAELVDGEASNSRSRGFGAWLLSGVATWKCLAAVAGAGITGLVVGLITAARADVEWVEAAGTWAGALATGATLLIAYSIFRAEQGERHDVRAVDDRRRHAERVELEETQAADAALVQAKVTHGGGGYFGVDPDGNRLIKVNTLRVQVANQALHPAQQVQVTYDGFQLWRNTFSVVKPEKLAVAEVTLADDQVLPEDGRLLEQREAEKIEVEFRMHNTIWVKRGLSEVRRRDA